MKTLRALLCMAIVLSVKFNLIGQTFNQKEELMKHLLDHVKPGMTQHQIDSLYERAKSNKDKNDANIKDLVMLLRRQILIQMHPKQMVAMLQIGDLKMEIRAIG